MYRFLHYEHLPKDKLLARKIKSNKNRYIVDNETNISFMEQKIKQTYIQTIVYS